MLYPTKDELQKVRLFFRANKNITFTWSAGAPKIKLKLGSLPGVYNKKVISVSGTKQNIRPDSISLPVGRYYGIITNSDSTTLSGVQAQASNNSAIVYSNQVEFIVESQSPPTSLGPVGNEASNTPLFRWTSVPGVSAYMILLSKTPFQVTRDPVTSELSVVGASLVWRYITTNTSAQYGVANTSSSYVNIPPAPLIPGNEYNYTILNVYDPENPAYASDVFGGIVSFKYTGASTINAPILREPADNVVLTNLNLMTFKWDPVQNANLYTVYLFKRTVSTSGAKQEIDVPFSNVAVSTNALVDFPASSSLTNGKYVWYVSASDANGNGNASKTFAFNYSVAMGVVRFDAVTTEVSTNNGLVGYEVRAKAISGGVSPGNAFVTVNDRYIVDSLVTGTYQLTCSKQGYADTTIVVAVTKSGTSKSPITITFPMKPYPATISGTVVDKTGKGVGSANVKLVNQSTNGEKNVTTSSSGEFSIKTDNGTYAIQAAKAGYISSVKMSLTASLGEQKVLPTSLVMTLDQASANGTVVNDAGAPVTLATVTATQGTIKQITTTNASGNYALTLTSGTWAVSPAKEGFVVPAPKQVVLAVGQTQQVANIVLLPNANTVNGYVYELITVNNQSGSSPLENAVVTATPSAGSVITVTTNAQGQYSLSLKQGAYRIQAARAQYSIISGTKDQYDLTVGVGQTVSGIIFKMSANPSSISGVIRLPDGSAVSGAIVQVVNDGSTVSSADGSYTLSVPPGTFSINSSKEGYGAPKPVTVSVAAGQKLSGINFEMLPNAGVITGLVKSAGEAVANVIVTAKSGSDSLVSGTNTVGEFTLSLSPATWKISASKTGFIPAALSVTIGPGQRSTGNIMTIVSNTGTIRGTVTDGATTIRNAQVRITSTENSLAVYNTVSKDDGTFAMTVPAQVAYLVSVSQTGYATKSATSSVLAAGSTYSAQFVLPPNPASINGVVFDQSAKQVSLAVVYLIHSGGGMIDSVVTDNNGKYTLGTSAGSFTIRSQLKGYQTDSTVINISVGQVLNNINLTMKEQFAILTGTVTSGGAALSGVLINVTGPQDGGTVITAGDGSFIIPRLYGGTYSIQTTKEGYSDSVISAVPMAEGQSRNIPFTLSILNGKISGTVRSKTGASITSASVVIRSATKTLNAVTDAAGKFSLSSVPLGIYYISAVKSGYSSSVVDTVELTPTSQQAVSLIADLSLNLLRIRGKVIDSLTRDAINDGTIAVSGTSGSGSAITDSKGEYLIENLSPGPATYTVTVEKIGYTSRSVKITPASTDSIAIVNASLIANTGKISGTVKDGSGAPLPFSVAMKATSNAASFTTTADAFGNFVFENIAKDTTYTVETDIYKSGYENVSTSVVFPPTAATVTGVRLVIEPHTAEVKGNAGVADAEVELKELSGKITPRIISSINDFSFSFKFLPPGSYTVKAKKSGYTITPSSSSVSVAIGQIQSVKFTAAADTSSILSKVIDASGIPMAFVEVSCISADTTVVRNGSSNTLGEAMFATLPAGRTYLLRASKNGYSSNTQQLSIVLQTNVRATANFIMTANTSAFNGNVIRAGTKTPISSAQISARRLSTGEQFTALTTTQGKFSFTGMPGDSFVVIAAKQGFSADTTRFRTIAGKTLALTDTLQLFPSTVNAQGTVLYEGKGVIDVLVTATSGSSVTTKTDANGKFTLSDIPVRLNDDTTIYQITMQKTGITTRNKKLVVLKTQLGKTIQIPTVVIPSGKIQLTITDGKKNLEGVKVTYTPPNTAPVESYTTRTGIFVTPKTLEQGEYRFAIEKEGYLSLNERFLRQTLSSDTSFLNKTISLPYQMLPFSEVSAGDSTIVSVKTTAKIGNMIGALYFKRSSQANFTKASMKIVGDTLLTGIMPAQRSTEKITLYTEIVVDSAETFTSAQQEVTPTAKGIISFVDFEPTLNGATLRLHDTYAIRLIVRDGANVSLGGHVLSPTRGKIVWRVSDSTAFVITQKDTLVSIQPKKVGTYSVTAAVTLDNVTLAKSFPVTIKESVLQNIIIGGTPLGNELNNRTLGIQLSIGSKDTSGKIVNLGSNVSWSLFPPAAGKLDSTGFLKVDSNLIGKISVTATDKLSKLTQKMLLNIIATIDSTRSYSLTDKNGMEIVIPKNAVSSPVDLLLEDASFGPAKKHVYVKSAAKNYVASPNLYFFNYKGGALNGDSLAKPATFRMIIDASLKFFEGEKIIGLYDPNTVEWKMLPSSAISATFSKMDEGYASAASPALQSSVLKQLKAQYTVLAQNAPLNLKHVAVLPNPFSPDIAPVKIGYLLTTTDQMALVTITIYNIRGELVRTLLENDTQYPGRYGSRSGNKQIVWNGKTDDGSMARNGRYIIQIRAKDSAGEKVELIPLVLIK